MKERTKKIITKCVSYALTFITVLFGAIMVYVLAQKARGEVPKFFGFCVLQIVSGSMETEIPTGSYILVKETDADEIEKGGCQLYLDLLPQYTEVEVYSLLCEKKAAFPDMPVGELLFGIVNNQVGRAVLRRAANDLKAAAKLVKAFSLTVTGSLGFDYAQVTKGGIPLSEVNRKLESRLQKGLYFAGEILDVDGQCGGFNLQWAFSSANVVATAILQKTRGQV